jgi:type II secretory pathway component PulM
MLDSDATVPGLGARRVMAILLVVGLLFLFGRMYSRYQNAAFDQIHKTLEEIAPLRDQLSDLASTVRSAQNAREHATSPRARLQNLYEVEHKYLQSTQRVGVSIGNMQSTGAYRRVFQPEDAVSRNLTALREWLDTERAEDHPLLPAHDQIDRKLAILAAHLAMYDDCLRFEAIEFRRIRTAINACVEGKARSLDSLP